MVTMTTKISLLLLLLRINFGHGQCSGTTLTLSANLTALGKIMSRNFPSTYPNNENCVWEITATGSVLFYVDYKRLETGIDNLLIYSGTQTGTKVYDSSQPRSYPTPYVKSSSGTKLTITFTSDNGITFGGFRMYYLDISSPSSCGSTLTSSTTPQQLSFIYRSQGSGCTWTITSSGLVEITVLMVQGHVHIEEGGIDDYITQTDAVVVTSTGSVNIIGDYQKDFVIQYEEVSSGTNAPVVTTTSEPISDCRYGNTLTATSTVQYLQSPSYPGPYPNSVTCTEVIQADNTEDSVYIEVIDIDIFPGDGINLYDGPSSAYNKLDGLSIGKIFTTSGRSAFVHFVTDTYGQNRGFRLSYHSVTRSSPTCGFYNYTLNANTTEQTLFSPNYPSNYDNNLNMFWLIIKPKQDDNIVLHFRQFDLETSVGCYFDSVTVYDGSCTTDPVLTKICGNEPSKYQDSTGLYILVGFKSDNTATEEGFELTYYIGSYDTAEDFSGELPAYAIVLIVIGIVVFMIIIVVVIIIIRKTNKQFVATKPEKPLLKRKRKSELWRDIYYMYSFKLNNPKQRKLKKKQEGVFHPPPNTEGVNIAVVTTGELGSHPPPNLYESDPPLRKTKIVNE